MKRLCGCAVIIGVMVFGSLSHTGAQNLSAPGMDINTVVSIRPEYVPPPEILDILGVHWLGNTAILKWKEPDGMHSVDIRYNAAANLIILSGGAEDVEYVETLIREVDIPPRQIEIEVQIIEINKSKARDIGVDWAEVVDNASPRISWRYSEDRNDMHDASRDPTHENIVDRESDRISRDFHAQATVDFRHTISLLDQAGAASIRSAPKILTLNNRAATILDGQRVTYVTRYSSYTNLFETDSMDAGLTLSVLPSLGESGYITLRINAEMTALDGTISGSPIKTGQLVENTIIVRDGESVLLGGLTRTVENRIHKRFPLLGHILPFIFSREITMEEEIESFMILTPRVVDFNTSLDNSARDAIEGM